MTQNSELTVTDNTRQAGNKIFFTKGRKIKYQRLELSVIEDLVLYEEHVRTNLSLMCPH